MKLTSPLLLLSILCAFTSAIAQTESNDVKQIVANDTVITYRIDTLSKYVGKQFFKKNYDQTIEFGELVLDLAEKNSYFDKYPAMSSFLGNAYLEIGDSLRAKEIFLQSITLAKQQNDTVGLITSEIDFANFYALRDENTSKEKAIALYKKIIPLAKKFQKTNKNNLLSLNSNISELYLDLKNPEQAAIYIEASEEYLDDKDIFEGYLGSAALNKARLLTQNGRYLEAAPFFQTSLMIFEKMNYLDGIIDVYHYSIDNALGRKNYQDAFEAQQQLDKFEIEKYNTDKIEALQTVTTRFKLDEIKAELQAQKLLTSLKEEKVKRDTTIFWVKIAAVILALFFGFIFYSYLKRRKLLSNLIVKNKQYLEEKERSEHLYKAKSQLFSNITHELRTPMYGIIGISNLLLENEKFTEEQQDLKSLKFSADYLLALVNNILHFNKLETNEIDALQISLFDIRTLVYSVIETSKFLSEEHPNKYNVCIDDSIPNILGGDRVKLSQILINLLGNASKFTNDGTIKISLKEERRSNNKISILFTIQDNGIGIDRNKVDSLFDQYSYNGDRQNFMGTGLGLPIVNKLLEQQNAKLNLQSEKNKGTIIKFVLRFNLANKGLKENDNANLEKDILVGLKILVVDDNKINQIVTKKFVERFGADCTLAKSGRQAIEITQQDKLDLILMDINMPEMNGFEATQEIRTFNRDVPIVALTAVDKEKVVGQHSFNLMNDIIIKPYSNEVFLDTVLRNLKKEKV